MYIYERIIGIATYVTTLFMICLVISKCEKKQLGKILFIYTLILSAMGFFFVPAKGADLYRLNIITETYAKYDLINILKYSSKTTTPIAILYMYFIGKTGITGLLPAITTFIVYSNIFYILKKTVIRYEIQTKQTFIVLLFFMSTSSFFEVISGIRTMLAFSIISRCVFEELIEDKPFIKNVIWYIIAGMIHSVGIVTIILRIIFLILGRQKTNFQKSLNILFFVISLIFLYTIGNTYFLEMVNKASEYITGGEYSYIWEYIIGLIMLINIIEIQHFYKKYIKKEHYNINIYNMYQFSIIINVILIVFATEYNIFHRFIILNTIIILPVLLNIIKYIHENLEDRRYKNFYNIIMINSILTLMIACARGNLSSLKFFELN